LDKAVVRIYLKRLAVVSAISFVLVIIFSESAFLLQKDRVENRPPEVITLTIPDGAAEQIGQGKSISSIPEEMVFVLGDVLEVRNEDHVTHRLGPMYIPAGTTATLSLNEADNQLLNCSFQATSYLGLDVRQPTTILTRLLAMLAAGPPTIVFLYLNSLLVYPIKGSEGSEADRQSG
jgi:hypothetical protein